MASQEEIASELRSEAGAILDRGLRGLLAAYGEVVVHGSCILDTMTHRDLDLYVVGPRFDVHRFFELGVALATLLTPNRMHFRDERAGSTDNLPHGLPELRAIILEIKAGVHSHPGYGRTFSSRDVYNGVLAGSVRSFADFEVYLTAREIKLVHRGRE